MSSSPDQKSKITVESLMRFKRAERPDADFWNKFDQELRQKQLTALLEKRPWWQNFPQLLAKKAYLPIGATAVLAFTLVSVKYYAPSQAVRTDVAANPLPTVAEHQVEVMTSSNSSSVTSSLVNRIELPALEGPVLANAEPVSVLLRDEAPIRKVVAVAQSTYSEPSESPSARSIAANLAHLEQSEPELLNGVLGARFGSPARLQNSSAPVVELASLSTVSSKRVRLVAHYNDRQINSERITSDAARERASRRLADADFNDSFSRIGLKGDQVSLKF